MFFFLKNRRSFGVALGKAAMPIFKQVTILFNGDRQLLALAQGSPTPTSLSRANNGAQ